MSPNRSVQTIITQTLISLATLVAVIPIMAGCNTEPRKQTVVLAASATRNEPAPALAPGDRQQLTAFGLPPEVDTDAIILSPAASGSSNRLLITPHLPNGQPDYGPRREPRLQDNLDAINKKLDSLSAATSNFDLLELMAQASRATSSPAMLLIISSGVTTAGGMDLRQVGWSKDPDAMASELKQRHLLPDLHGFRVIFSGLGIVAGDQPRLNEPQRRQLVAYWKAVCKAAGAASCDVNDEPRANRPSHSAAKVPIVAVPTVTSVQGPDGSIKNILPDSVLGFAGDSAQLNPTADTVLTPIVDQARDHQAMVNVTGHSVQLRGSPPTMTLSETRARAVANRLIQLGLPSDRLGRVTGVGPTADPPLVAYNADGTFNEEEASRYRRVIVDLIPANTQ